jgi:hypothetical protein
MALLVAQNLSPGFAPSFSLVNPDGDQFKLEDHVFIWARNNDTTNKQITIPAKVPCNQGFLHGMSSLVIARRNEVQTVTITGSPTGGTFKLGLDGSVTSDIAPDATASAVGSALVALPTIGTGNVAVTGSAGGPYTVTFQGALANRGHSLLTKDSLLLTGGTTPNISIDYTTSGSDGTALIGPFGNHLVDANYLIDVTYPVSSSLLSLAIVRA